MKKTTQNPYKINRDYTRPSYTQRCDLVMAASLLHREGFGDDCSIKREHVDHEAAYDFDMIHHKDFEEMADFGKTLHAWLTVGNEILNADRRGTIRQRYCPVIISENYAEIKYLNDELDWVTAYRIFKPYEIGEEAFHEVTNERIEKDECPF